MYDTPSKRWGLPLPLPAARCCLLPLHRASRGGGGGGGDGGGEPGRPRSLVDGFYQLADGAALHAFTHSRWPADFDSERSRPRRAVLERGGRASKSQRRPPRGRPQGPMTTTTLWCRSPPWPGLPTRPRCQLQRATASSSSSSSSKGKGKGSTGRRHCPPAAPEQPAAAAAKRSGPRRWAHQEGAFLA